MTRLNPPGQPGASGVGTEPSTTNRNDPVPDLPIKLVERIQLSDGYSVTPEFFDEIRLHIQGRLPELQSDGNYEAKQLAGKAFWELLSSGDQRTAGRCIAYLTVRCQLPLIFVEGKHEYPLRYRLK